jgi:hypothetical protein
MSVQLLQQFTDAMAKAISAQQENQRISQQKSQFGEDLKLRQQAEQRMEDQINKEFDLRSQELQNQHDLTQAQIEASRTANLKGLSDLAASGVDINKLVQSGAIKSPGGPGGSSGAPPQPNNPLNFRGPQSSTTPQGSQQPSPTAPTMQNLFTGAFPTPEQSMQRRIQEAGGVAGAQASATAGAQEPYVEKQMGLKNQYDVARANANNDFERDMLNRKQVFEAAQNADQRLSAEKIAGLSRGTQMAIANIENNTRKYGIDQEYGLPSGGITGLMMDIAGGNTKVDINNPRMQKIVSLMESQGMKQPGTDVDELKALQGAEDGLQSYRNFVNNTLSSSKIGRTVQQGVASVYPTDAKKALQAAQSNMISIEKSLEGFSGSSRLKAMFETAGGALPDLTDTQKNGNDKLDSLENQLNQRRQQILKNYNPQQIEIMQMQNPNLHVAPFYTQNSTNKNVPKPTTAPPAPAVPRAIPSPTQPTNGVQGRNQIKYTDLMGQQQ